MFYPLEDGDKCYPPHTASAESRSQQGIRFPRFPTSVSSCRVLTGGVCILAALSCGLAPPVLCTGHSRSRHCSRDLLCTMCTGTRACRHAQVPAAGVHDVSWGELQRTPQHHAQRYRCQEGTVLFRSGFLTPSPSFPLPLAVEYSLNPTAVLFAKVQIKNAFFDAARMCAHTQTPRQAHTHARTRAHTDTRAHT